MTVINCTVDLAKGILQYLITNKKWASLSSIYEYRQAFETMLTNNRSLYTNRFVSHSRLSARGSTVTSALGRSSLLVLNIA